MKLTAVTVAVLVIATLQPIAAGTLSIDVTGVLGPVLQGSDPVHLAGDTFTATGAINPSAFPISTSGYSAAYDLAGNLQITLGSLTLTGYNAMLIITAPPSGPDTVVLDFSVLAFSATPDVTASFTLPSGTLNGNGIQSLWASVTEPAGNLGYSVPGATTNLTGTLGMDGSISIAGSPGSAAPEPGTAGLLAGGLLLAVACYFFGSSFKFTTGCLRVSKALSVREALEAPSKSARSS